MVSTAAPPRCPTRASLAGSDNGGGTITFNLYGSGDQNCTLSPVYSQTDTVSGDGTYSSGSATPTGAGTYHWIASYSGNANNAATAGTCITSGESVAVQQASPAISTTSSSETSLGSTVTDTATLTQAYNISGQTITFKLFGPATSPNCSGSAAYSSTGTIGLSGMSYVATSGHVTPTHPGTYYWVATYGGDTNNTTARSNCGDVNESVTVYGLSPAGPVLPKGAVCPALQPVLQRWPVRLHVRHQLRLPAGVDVEHQRDVQWSTQRGRGPTASESPPAGQG